ncbi:hypothetical protein [Streptomyces zingiberis]|uniref:Albusnodin family lasso peptide n=1 Tax=Streptomyces zingiberis TaxID=2053010 RepID=A0ABX1C7C8_9ACTN|nr:hypothetical protein [Streptomyces zingiberis]NJQ03837.1 hypothetical protein [Streptomyces zingiberis]
MAAPRTAPAADLTVRRDRPSPGPFPAACADEKDEKEVGLMTTVLATGDARNPESGISTSVVTG